MNRYKTTVVIIATCAIAFCACAQSDWAKTNSPNVNLDMTNSCIKSFCGFAFGSPYQRVDFMTNGVVECSNWYHSQYRPFTNITVKLDRPFRFCTQAQLEYTPYTMKLFKVTIKGHIGARLTHESLLEESNKMRKIIEGQGHFRMKDILPVARLRRPNQSLFENQDRQGGGKENETPLRTLPFSWDNPYCRMTIHSFVDDNGTTFMISVEDLMTEREDKESEIAARKDLSLDSSQDSDMELFEIVQVPEEQRILLSDQVTRRGIMDARLQNRLQRNDKDCLLEPVLPFSNAVQSAMHNNPSGYYSLALHFAKGEEVDRHYPRACLLLEQAVSNHYSNAELIYAMIQIGNSDLATEESRPMDAPWGMGFRRREVSDAKRKLTELFKQYTGLLCDSTFFSDIKGIDLANESEVARLKSSLLDFGHDSGTKMDISKKVTSLLDDLVSEKKRNIENNRTKQKYVREVREQRDKNEALAEAVLGFLFESPNNAKSLGHRPLMRLRQQKRAETSMEN